MPRKKAEELEVNPRGSKTGGRHKGDPPPAAAELLKGKAAKEGVAKPRAGESRKSEDPAEPDRRRRVTIQLGKRWSQIVTEIKSGEYTWAEFAESLDPEELARGQLKDVNGEFRGRPPALVPRAFHDACMKELHRRFNEKIQGRLIGAVDELIELSKAGHMEPKDRAKTLIYIIERVMGPVPKVVEVTQEQPWQMTVQGLLRPAADGGPGKAPVTKDRYAKRRRKVDPSEDIDE